jgi:chromatin structure-remodeling complex protein RSC7
MPELLRELLYLYFMGELTKGSAFNSQLTQMRKEALNGVYNIHTNVMEYPKHMQPTHARWEPVLNASMGSLSLNAQSNGIANGEVVSVDKNNDTPKKRSAVFPELDPVYAKNFMIHDIYYESAPYSNMGVPGPDGDEYDILPNSLSNIPADVLEELPPDCRKAFDEALAHELEWKNKWRTEAQDGHRGTFQSNYSWAG